MAGYPSRRLAADVKTSDFDWPARPLFRPLEGLRDATVLEGIIESLDRMADQIEAIRGLLERGLK